MNSTVEARLIDYILPDEIDPNKPFFVSIALETTGSGEDFIFGGIMDEYVPNLARGWVTDKKIGPGKVGTMRNNFPPLVEWYERDFGRPIPDVLMWRAVVGWAEERPEGWLVHITDLSPVKSIPVRAPPPQPPEEEKEGIWEWIKAHSLELAAASGGLMIGAAILTRK